MAKSGFAVADRKKVEAVDAGKTVEVHDCGTIFIVEGGNTLTLPTASAAGKGWWIRIIKSDEGNAVAVTATSSLDGQGVDGDEIVSLSGNCAIGAAAGKGSWLEICSDGTQYYATGIADDNAGLTA